MPIRGRPTTSVLTLPGYRLQQAAHAAGPHRTRGWSPRLPIHLIVEIVSHIPTSDSTTLSACARISRSLYHPSQKCLFRHVDVYLESFFYDCDDAFPKRRSPKRYTAKALYTLLRRAPHLAKYIKGLSVHVGTAMAEGEERLYLSNLIPLLSDIKSVAFPRFSEAFGLENRADSATVKYIPALHYHQKASIVELDVSALIGAQMPSLAYLREFPNVKRLALRCSFANSPAEHEILQAVRSPVYYPLEALSLTGNFNEVFRLVTSPSFPYDVRRLRSLRLDYLHDFKQPQLLAHLLSMYSNISEFSQVADYWLASSEYHFPSGKRISKYPFQKYPPPNLGYLTKLKTITLRGEITMVPTPPLHEPRLLMTDCWLPEQFKHPLRWMADLLAQLPTHNRVEEITIVLDFTKYYTTNILAVVEWGTLESVLCPEYFPRLRRVSVKINVSNPLEPRRIPVQTPVIQILQRRDVFPRLKAARRLRFEVTPIY